MLRWVEAEEEAKMRVLKLLGIVENKKKDGFWLYLQTASTGELRREKVTGFDSG